MPTAYILIGVPGSGKSTYIENVLKQEAPNAVIAGTDLHIEQFAKENNQTYDSVFKEQFPIALDKMLTAVTEAIKNNQDIIWDQTSVAIDSRKKKFNMIPPNYKMVAVALPIPDNSELQRRLASRLGKTIPKEVVLSMIKSFTLPSLEEGFTEIRYIKEKL
jgi:predicted kinase